MKKFLLYFLLTTAAFGQGTKPPVTTLSGLSDVNIGFANPLLANDLLTYDVGSAKWTNAPLPLFSLSNSSDVGISSPANHQILWYDSGTSTWLNYGPLAFSDITGHITVSQTSGSGGANATTYWRGDNTWASPPTGSIPSTTTLLAGDGGGNAAATIFQPYSGGYQVATSASVTDVPLAVRNSGATGSASLLIGTDLSTHVLALTSWGQFATPALTIAAASDSAIITEYGNLILANNGVIKGSNNLGTSERWRFGNGLAVGTTTDPGPGSVNVSTSYQINNTNLSAIYSNGSAAGLTTCCAANTIIPGSTITLPAGAWKVGGAYHCIFDMVKTNAGTATIALNIHMGTSGTTSDAIVGTVNMPNPGTAGADAGLFDVYATFKSVGGGTSAVINSYCRLVKQVTSANGLVALAESTVLAGSTSSGFNSSTPTKISVGFNGGASFSGTNFFAQTEYKQ